MAELARRGVMLVLASPSGAGKSSISRAIFAQDPNISLSVSVTTRARRTDELDGRDYHFIDIASFERMRANDELLESAEVQEHFQKVIDRLAGDATGSANRIARAALVSQPPSIDKGEVTDKGSINQRAVLKHRDAEVQALHGDTLPFTLKPQWQ